MAFTVADVLTPARYRHSTFDEVTHSTTAAANFLFGWAHRVRQRILQLDPRRLVEQQSIALPLAVFSEGTPLNDHELIHEVMAIQTDGGTASGDPVALIPSEQRHDPGVWPAAWVVAGRLYLKGTEGDWGSYGTIWVNYVPVMPAMFTTADDEVPLPEMFRTAATEELAAWMALRSGAARCPVRFADAQLAQANEASSLAFATLTRQRAYEDWRIREVG